MSALQPVVSALPKRREGEDRHWLALLACGHEKRLLGRLGLKPRRGRSWARCTICEREETPHVQ